jgi:predicted O-methyltransferase YrrM
MIEARIRWSLISRARDLARRATGIRDPWALWQLLREYPEFLPLQHEAEIVRFLHHAKSLSPTTICEIGTASGGTSFLLSRIARPGSTVVTLDRERRPGLSAALAILGGPDCRITSLTADSHDQKTVKRVHDVLGSVPLDLLFIDGDHEYGGVRQDFESFRKLVRIGGVIAFHDIIPDSKSRGGPKTGGDAGGVPGFWQEVSRRYPRSVQEIVERPDQDGCGIGILVSDAAQAVQ